jgi:hypothetical protein
LPELERTIGIAMDKYTLDRKLVRAVLGHEQFDGLEYLPQAVGVISAGADGTAVDELQMRTLCIDNAVTGEPGARVDA